MSDTHTSHRSRFAIDPATAARMGTEDLRRNFLVEDLFQPGKVNLTYTHYDRMIVGGATPTARPLPLEAIRPTGTKAFLDRRELIAVNIGGAGTIEAGGERHRLETRDMLYVGMGNEVSFASDDAANPARFYLLSAPAHQSHPTRLIRIGEAKRIDLGSPETCNERSIFQFIHPEGAKTCQLVVGMTNIAPGSVWNTMPAHVHDRRMEAYLYFDLPETARVFHFMGEPTETRHIVMRNEQAVLSPPWSIHSGCGTAGYTFIWAMAGDNVDYTDVEMVDMGAIR
ncbi:5-dehydro-4-deoxy-D-glucuronate isomerase [Nitratireductor mangrovi]|uniref:4-deoxy-L-threo-5-hexosulose-uronate ketol-isomerase n=1 Tax=Nitratireductor mangrovi TaxID=2599600 RepID=A0A5B8KVW8_9HYPH|nr:5-dehydro-4-deoxy-D-glucuronate isomerase [Nitratireductor mangrovi]QDY99700.1 5-dehydro-4-deoxy-D-glucuronate isomerase [Nitratireductor mangrovi]